eukprot:TRINITY_DN7013_c0_g1_i1.p1 TRINITY_DN7013_c0_g1~~TRINITY_DN7013_c0_g1_i1.p1  ORF type:complete len:221 (+),score=33.23 TRINITY_DN7013_c0_g1_i1:79-741(+)
MGRVRNAVLTILSTVSERNRGQKQPVFLGLDFECVQEPGIVLGDYARQICPCGDDGIWIVVLVLLHRLEKQAGIYFAPCNAHRLLLVTYVIALKLTHDTSRINGRVPGGVDLDDLCEMEAAFLQLVDWRVYIDPSTFKRCGESLTELARCRCAASEVPAPVIPDRVVSAWGVPAASAVGTGPRPPACPRAAATPAARSSQAARRRTSRLHAAIAQARVHP